MEYSSFIKSIFLSYGVDMSTDSGKVQIANYRAWLEANVPQSELQAFYNKVLNEYIPTSVNPVPTIAHLNKIHKDIDRTEDFAMDLATKIVCLPDKYTRYDYDMAKKSIGDYGWNIIKQVFGSYSRLCENLTYDNESIIKAQVRDFIKGNMKLYNKDKKLTDVLNMDTKKQLN